MDSDRIVEIEDWLQDPLRTIKEGKYEARKLKNTKNNQQDKWFGFHFATRLKLEGADFFCRQALGAASMSYDCGLPLLAHRLIEWYLEVFFFELMSAYETLLQELNIVYDLGLKPERVRWNDKDKNEFMKKLPDNILQRMTKERKKGWFDRVRRYRNTATHHYTVPLASGGVGWGGNPIDYSETYVDIHYLDKTGNYKSENIDICKKYLRDMVKHISSIWEIMAKNFKE